jgi:hypothetical protein
VWILVVVIWAGEWLKQPSSGGVGCGKVCQQDQTNNRDENR